MTYNVGPDYTRSAEGPVVRCPCCRQLMTPAWDGANGIWICPICYEDLPDYEESNHD